MCDAICNVKWDLLEFSSYRGSLSDRLVCTRTSGSDPERTSSTGIRAQLETPLANADFEPVGGISTSGTDDDQILSSARQFSFPRSCVVCLSRTL